MFNIFSLGVRSYPGSEKYFLPVMIIVFLVLGYTWYSVNKKVNLQRKFASYLKNNLEKDFTFHLEDFNNCFKTKFRTINELSKFLQLAKRDFDNLHFYKISFQFKVKSDHINIVSYKK